MNKEIEELFKKFDIILENYELDKTLGQLSVDSIYHLFPTEIMDLKKYIQDLQYQLKEKDKVIDEAIKYIKDNLIIASILDGKTTYCLNSYSFDYEDLLEILERGKNNDWNRLWRN